jgi:FtsP/CotA-like multicopper oxidase with cupredoxin domain/plastocyanin
MANIELWIQLENHAWDLVTGHLDRMTGHHFPHVPMTLTSPVTGVSRTPNMHKPLGEDALILRRYTPNWAAPDDRKVNPWDLNELDPTDNGTMGTIPGPVIECEVGDSVTVHFRNLDTRDGKSVEERTHSLHPHGFVFEPTSDGAYPLSPPDPAQPVGAEAALWSALGVTNLKKGDRVPPPVNPGDPGGTFTYTWQTRRWPSTAGVWLYHDHSICDSTNVDLGAIGIIVIHNSNDPEDVIVGPEDLPGGSPIGSPVRVECFPIFRDVAILPGDLEGLGAVRGLPPALEGDVGEGEVGPPVRERLIQRENLLLELDPELRRFIRLCWRVYRTPPRQAQYLVLIHEMAGGLMCINGRQYLGNTPTLVSGPETKMRFGVVGMGSGQHTFHLHGHRWVIPGPDGTDPGTIQNSPQVRAVSQFEDTRIFGPANSFAFTIQQDAGSFMGAFPGTAFGEWHMHCHVLSHMMSGMMGSLLVVNGGSLALPLPEGVACPGHEIDGGHGGGGHGTATEVTITGFNFPTVTVPAGAMVRWRNNDPDSHTVIWDTPGSPPNINTPIPTGGLSNPVTMPTAGTFNYHCGIHPGMLGSIIVTP